MNSPEEELTDAIHHLCDKMDEYLPELTVIMRALLRRLD